MCQRLHCMVGVKSTGESMIKCQLTLVNRRTKCMIFLHLNNKFWNGPNNGYINNSAIYLKVKVL